MHRLTCLTAMICLPALAQADPWHGIWSAEPDWCVNAERIGSVTPAPILLSASEMLGYENSCDITAVDEVDGLSAWQIDITCQSEGDLYEERRLIMVDGDRMWMWFGADEPLLFTRCPA